jgi:predicted DNA helicase
MKLWVRGLGGEGPGDIVGAFAGETGIDGDRIGEIDLGDGEAVVEVDREVADRVVDAMDGNRVGSSIVRVSRLSGDVDTIRSYVRRFTRLVEMEREEEMRRHEQEIRSLSGREREEKGRALLDMRGREEGEGLGGVRVKFMKETKGEPLPDTEISTGDLVMISKTDPLRDDNPTGTVTQVTGYSVTASFDEAPDRWMTGDGLRVDLYVNDVTYQRMKDALARLPDAEGALRRLRDVCAGTANPSPNPPAEVEDWHNERLNDSQKQAVRESLATEDVHLIHGPPGTGKTTTAIEVIRQCVDRGESVLATAASNTAVDNLLEFLVQQGVDAVRLGHPARVSPALQEHTLDARIQDNETYRASQEVREEAFALLDERDDLTAPSGRYRRGMSDEKIQRLAEEGRGSRGVSPEKIAEMAEWLRLREKADELFDEAEALEDEAIGEELDAADVVCTTNATAGSDLLDGRTVDTLVIDEATQATAPSCWIPIVHADRVIMAGDHKQLPPTIQNEEAAREGLRRTLFERLAHHHDTTAAEPSSIRSLLRVQYRMHETIMDFPSRTFYDDRLRADASVKRHTLEDLGVRVTDVPGEDRAVLDPVRPLVFVDTSEIDAPETQRRGSTSRENPTEAEIVVRLARNLLRAGVEAEDIAVIAPYDDQVRRLTDRLERAPEAAVEDGLEVDTVDGFQGREKEVVLVSLVRSNPEGRIGFLDEPRRFNVSLTRAKRKAVVVGDRSTVRAGEVFARFARYAEEKGLVVEA